MMGQLGNPAEGDVVEGLNVEELECKICYCPYSLGGRRPKLLECRHCLCAKCLAKILDLGESAPGAVVCPFCRYITSLPAEAASGLPDDCRLLSTLALQNWKKRNARYDQEGSTELLLSPKRLSSLMGGDRRASPSPPIATTYSSIRGSPNFVVITIMEPPPPSPRPYFHPPGAASVRGYRTPSVDSMVSVVQRCDLWNCVALLCHASARVLVWVLGLLYFSSLPMGVYLLILQKSTLGLLLVSLVPASLLITMAYGLCQCICHELWDCMPP